MIGHREHPDLGDLVGPELDADGMLGGGREDIENAAAHRELAAPSDHVDPGVGQFGEARDEAVVFEFGADPKGHRVDLCEVWRHRLKQRAHRGHHHAKRRAQVCVVGAGQAAQQHHPGADGVHPGR